jgi:DNA-directed RNA polymerase specialized sigma24 family protein
LRRNSREFARLFEDFHRRSAPGVQEFLQARTSDRDLAEDRTQEVFLRACVELPSIPRENWEQWLRANEKEIAQGWVPAREIPFSQFEDIKRWKAGPLSDPEQRCLANERVRDIFGLLRPHLHRRLLMREAKGWSYAQIAAWEGISVRKVKDSLHRARETLRAWKRNGGRLAALFWFPATHLLPRRRPAYGREIEVAEVIGSGALIVSLVKLIALTTVVGAVAFAGTLLGGDGRRAEAKTIDPQIITRVSAISTTHSIPDSTDRKISGNQATLSVVSHQLSYSTKGSSADASVSFTKSTDQREMLREIEITLPGDLGTVDVHQSLIIKCDSEVRRAGCDAGDKIP